MTDTALAPIDPPTTAIASPLPLYTGPQMAEALTAYRELQTALDRSMPDQIMQLDGKPFRKKGYWRAIAVAFGLTVEPVEERREVEGQFVDGRDNFGFRVTYRATAPNGRSVSGDGSCFAVEKARRFRCPHPQANNSNRTIHWPHESCPDFDPAFQWKALPAQSTEHNIRSHAHTRAFNRAVSNLVGFGEVSAEEVERGETIQEPAKPQPASTQASPATARQAPAQPSAPQYAAAQTRPDGSVVGHVQESTSVKTGRNNNGPWTLYAIRLHGDPRRFTTFSDSIASAAKDVANTPTRVAIKVTEKPGTNGPIYTVQELETVPTQAPLPTATREPGDEDDIEYAMPTVTQ